MTDTADAAGAAKEFVTVTIASQMFGIPVLAVQDVLGPQRIAHIPLAATEVAGALNLRGRIVTAIDLRRRLGLSARADGEKSMSVVVDHHGEFYSLIVDTVGEVLTLSTAELEPNPATLDPLWRGVSSGIYRLDKELLVIFDVEQLLELSPARRAA